jgi:hypothetical protein
VICGQGNLLARIAQRVTTPLGAGVVDGANGSFCTVPSTASWVVGGAVLLAFLALAFVVRRLAMRSRSPKSADGRSAILPAAS